MDSSSADRAVLARRPGRGGGGLLDRRGLPLRNAGGWSRAGSALAHPALQAQVPGRTLAFIRLEIGVSAVWRDLTSFVGRFPCR